MNPRLRLRHKWDDYDIAFTIKMIIKHRRFECIEWMNKMYELRDVPTNCTKPFKYDPF
jgi:hypothetical protein